MAWITIDIIENDSFWSCGMLSPWNLDILYNSYYLLQVLILYFKVEKIIEAYGIETIKIFVNISFYNICTLVVEIKYFCVCLNKSAFYFKMYNLFSKRIIFIFIIHIRNKNKDQNDFTTCEIWNYGWERENIARFTKLRVWNLADQSD